MLTHNHGGKIIVYLSRDFLCYFPESSYEHSPCCVYIHVSILIIIIFSPMVVSLLHFSRVHMKVWALMLVVENQLRCGRYGTLFRLYLVVYC